MENTLDVLNDVLGEITFIKWTMIAMMLLLALFGAAIFFALRALAKVTERIAEGEEKHIFWHDADELLEQDKLDELIEFAKDKISTHPKHTYAHWYLALAYYHKGKWHDAIRAFRKVGELEPTWREAYVDPYVEELELKIKNSSPQLVQ